MLLCASQWWGKKQSAVGQVNWKYATKSYDNSFKPDIILWWWSFVLCSQWYWNKRPGFTFWDAFQRLQLLQQSMLHLQDGSHQRRRAWPRGGKEEVTPDPWHFEERWTSRLRPLSHRATAWTHREHRVVDGSHPSHSTACILPLISKFTAVLPSVVFPSLLLLSSHLDQGGPWSRSASQQLAAPTPPCCSAPGPPCSSE